MIQNKFNIIKGTRIGIRNGLFKQQIIYTATAFKTAGGEEYVKLESDFVNGYKTGTDGWFAMSKLINNKNCTLI